MWTALRVIGWAIAAAMVAGGAFLVYDGFQALGTRAADDAPLFFIVGGALGVSGLVSIIRLIFSPGTTLTKGQTLELKQVAGLGTAREPIEPARKTIWVLSPISLLLVAGGLAILAALWSSPPLRSGEEPWLIAVAMRAAFGIGLTLAGVILGVAIIRRYLDAREDAHLRAAHPDSPWKWRNDWARGRIRQERGGWLLIGWPLAFIVLGFALQAASTLFVAKSEFDLRLIGGLVLLVGVPLGMFVVLAVAIARRLKYGRSELVLDTVPLVVGGALRGRIEAPIRNWRPAPDGPGFSVTFSSIRMRTTGGTTKNKTQSIQKMVLWSAETKVPASQVGLMGNGVAVPVAFSLPGDALMTNKFDANDQVFWPLDVRAAQPGLDYHEWFEVPVFGKERSG